MRACSTRREMHMGAKTSNLAGTWKLVSLELEAQQSGSREPMWGDVAPRGSLILTAEGRMLALLTGGSREPGTSDDKQAALFRTMLAYGGAYRVEGDKFVTRVDVSWNEAWNGTDQVRYFKLSDNRLEIVTEWVPSPMHADQRIVRGILSWTRGL